MPGSYFCLYFSKGQCWKGPACEYLHRIPTIHDHFNPSVDAFGRDKHQDYRYAYLCGYFGFSLSFAALIMFLEMT